MSKQSWRDPSAFITKIHVDEECRDHPYTKEILDRAGLPWEIVPSGQSPKVSDKEYPENFSEGKKNLYLTTNKGKFFKPCPGTKEYRCCDYQVLNTGMNCPIDCVYCILQAYLNNPWISFYVNSDEMLAEIDEVIDNDPGGLYRIGTGEFTDSLAIDNITHLSRILVPYMADKKNAMLELKTKSGVVENILDLDHRGNTVVAWSLNSTRILKQQELRAASLDERLEAARLCAAKGYRLAFHFDPIIYHDSWEKEYRETIEKLYTKLDPESIVWISLGALRYLPSLKDIGIKRFPGSNIYFQEFIEGLDGKSRYFRDTRTRIYRTIYQHLKTHAAPDTAIYFCMESDEIWRDVMGYTPEERGGIGKMLDRAFWGDPLK